MFIHVKRCVKRLRLHELFAQKINRDKQVVSARLPRLRCCLIYVVIYRPESNLIFVHTEICYKNIIRIWHSEGRASWYILIIKVKNALFLNFILVKNSTCFGQTYCPSSGILILYSQQLVFVILVMLTVCWRGQDLASSQST